MKLTPIDCTLCENEFGRYCVPKSSQHRPAPQEVVRGLVWERPTIEFMRAHADRDIVHAGMFFGDFLPGLSSKLVPGRVIYGFEPNPENFIAAQWTALLNGLENVRMHNCGLGETSKSAPMQMFENGRAIGGGSRIIHGDATSSPDIQPIEIAAIDEIIPPAADIGILQLDVEGYEEYALRGAMRTIEKHRPIIILETVPQQFVEERLSPLGYKRSGMVCDNTVYAI